MKSLLTSPRVTRSAILSTFFCRALIYFTFSSFSRLLERMFMSSMLMLMLPVLVTEAFGLQGLSEPYLDIAWNSLSALTRFVFMAIW